MTESVTEPRPGDVRPGADRGLSAYADAPVLTLFHMVSGSPRGLTEGDAAERLRVLGENEPFRPLDHGLTASLVSAVRSPFVALLAVLGAVFAGVGDLGAAATVAVIVAIAVGLRAWQQTSTFRATRTLQGLVNATVTVRRRAGPEDEPVDREVAMCDVVDGDVVLLYPGDIVPADLRIVSASDLVVDQSVLTGESLPTRKLLGRGISGRARRPSDALCFSGTAVVAGTATAVVIATGARTQFGTLARSAGQLRPESSFDRGVRGVGWTLLRFTMAMAPIVFVVNGLVGGVWMQAAMFAVAVAVGLTPEMLPVIVTANLARGANRLARENVVVSRLNAIQDLGAMDVLCVDKTGTLTEDRIVYARSVDAGGHDDGAASEFARLAVQYQDFPQNRIDEAILEMAEDTCPAPLAARPAVKVDEIGFDHLRRRTSVVLSSGQNAHLLVCKGDPDRVLSLCEFARIDGASVPLDDAVAHAAADTVADYHHEGMRVLAVATRRLPRRVQPYTAADECGLELMGFVGFVDPVRRSAHPAVRSLAQQGVEVKVLTGDHPAVAARVAALAGIEDVAVITGAEIDRLIAEELRDIVRTGRVFASLTPAHKTRIVTALRDDGRAVGFLGDGVNDVAALRLADVGVAADTATAVAKQAADLILLDKDLAVVARGVSEGRRTLANTMKYVKITASSNLGNALSVVVASAFLPFLPILPVQLMIQNLLYDAAQLALPFDRVDPDYLRAPRRWDSGGLVRFMVVFGSLSTLFDMATFAALWWWFGGTHAPMFQTGWFVEGLLTQLVVLLVLRSRGFPLRTPRPSPVLVAAAVVVAVVGVALPLSPFAGAIGMTPPPIGFVLWIVAVTVLNGLAAHWVKTLYLRRYGTWL